MKKITVSAVLLLFFLLFSACGKKLPSQKLTITRADGRIIVDADITELFRKHPNLEEGYTDGFYYYCRRDKRDKVMWYEDMYGREQLLQALQQLIQN